MQYLKVKVNPRSTKSCLSTLSDGTLKINVRALAENNKANQEVIQILAEHYQVPKDKVKIISGHTSNIKLIRLN